MLQGFALEIRNSEFVLLHVPLLGAQVVNCFQTLEPLGSFRFGAE